MAADFTLWALLALILAGVAICLAGGLLAVPAMLVAPAAARLSRRLPQRLLARGFALCLFAIAVRVVWRAWGGG